MGPYQSEAKKSNRTKILQTLVEPKTFTQLWNTLQPTLKSRSALSNHLSELKEEHCIVRQVQGDDIVYVLTPKGKSEVGREAMYVGHLRNYFDKEIDPHIEDADENFLKTYAEKLAPLILYAAINDIQAGGGLIEAVVPLVKDTLWIEKHISAQAKVGSYGPKANDIKEVLTAAADIKQNPKKFRKQIESLRASLKQIYPDEIEHLEKVWQYQH
ncbi:MAG TPA: ArsR family transcriptional regulator [Candidatus Acidoferrum sp.]|nr:ArsR family transcriptional regulator [Candidatus Acidoferrum sp.]